MFGSIVLLDIPKEAIQIDLASIPIQGGFRGFSMVPPGSWHYVSVKHGDYYEGFWCWLNVEEVVVKRFDPDRGFINPDQDTIDHYTNLARSGAMGPALREYPHEFFGSWYGLVMYLGAENFPPPLHDRDSPTSESRFRNALMGTHGGDPKAFLAEFQYAFVSWLMSLDTAHEATAAFDRWFQLLLAIYNAGEFNMRDHADLFSKLVDLLVRQFSCLADSYFDDDSWLIEQVDYLLEDLADTELPELMNKSQILRDYLNQRDS